MGREGLSLLSLMHILVARFVDVCVLKPLHSSSNNKAKSDGTVHFPDLYTASLA